MTDRPAATAPAQDSVTAVWEGGLRSRVTADGAEFVVDPAGPSPTDFLLVSIASCYAAALAWEARKRRLDLPDLSVTATGTYQGRRFGRLLLTVRTSLPVGRLERLLKPALRVCYVSNTISDPAAIEVAVA